MTSHPRTPAADLLQGGGEVGDLIRAATGPNRRSAPPGMAAAVANGRRICFCNRGSRCSSRGETSSASSTTTPYAEILGAKHPRALGRRFHDIWSEIWPDISPLIDAAMAGQAIYREDLPLVMNRKGYDEQTWFTFSYSPLRDESGKVAGMFCAVSETTRRVLAERALRELNETLERRVNEALAQRKLLADIVEGTNAFVQVVDLDYRWLAINRAAADEFERIFGVRPKVGDSMLELLASQPEHQAAVKAVWSRALGGEEFVEIGEFGDPARDRRFYEMRYNTLRDRDGDAHRRVPVRVRRHRAPARPGAPAQGRGGASPGAEAGVARPADRRRGTRLQQSAGGVRERLAAAGAQRDRRAAGARPRRHAPRRGTRNRTDAPAAGVHAPPGHQSGVDRPCGPSQGMREMLERSLRRRHPRRDGASEPNCGRSRSMRASSSWRC